MTPTPEQVAQWAREADCGFGVDGGAMGESVVGIAALTRLVTRAMAEQAEADAKLCDENAQRSVRQLGSGAWAPAPADSYAAAIRTNAPKVTT
ncbi:MAG: hypothetical protein V4738_14380 [Pseudomonadota bacterium]